MPRIDTHLLKRSMTGPENECGDTGVVKVYDNTCFFALIDVLGHGKKAHEVAVTAKRYLLENHSRDLVDLMNGLHSHLKGTRGAVALFGRLNLVDGGIRYVGMGNITARLYGMGSASFISRDGVIGYNITAPKEQQTEMHPGDILILSSDGVKAHFDWAFYPDLLKGSAQKIAADLINRLGKDNDDASCIVLRYGK